MKKLSDMSIGDRGLVLYLPFDFYDSRIRRFAELKVILNIFGNVLIKTEYGIKFIGKETASLITCE